MHAQLEGDQEIAETSLALGKTVIGAKSEPIVQCDIMHILLENHFTKTKVIPVACPG
jgi:hypothetical protein